MENERIRSTDTAKPQLSEEPRHAIRWSDAALCLGMIAFVGLSGCAKTGGGDWRWDFFRESKAARDPDPNAPAYMETRPLESATTPEAQLAASNETHEDDPSIEEHGQPEQAVHEYLSKLDAATKHPAGNNAHDESPKHRAAQHSQTEPQQPAQKGHHTHKNSKDRLALGHAYSDDADEVDAKPSAQSLPANEPARRIRKPSVASVGVRAEDGGSERSSHARTNQPAIRVQQGMDLNELSNAGDLPDLIQAAKAAVQSDPANAQKQLRLSLLQLASNRPKEAAQLSPAIELRHREVIAGIVASIGRVDSQFSDPMLNTKSALASIEDLRAALRDTVDLTIPTVALCSKVTTFGVYNELPKGALRAHHVNRAIVYCEVEDFASQFDEATNQYRTELSCQLELFTSKGTSVWQRSEERINDVSRRRREDFFIAQLITLPHDLAAGDYVLKVAITDLQASRTTEAVHRLRVR
ncbi:MAG: hypothetical protein GXP29_08395 [Planctomycetes bacterium]|nr:hypothetical protein [Planctomycetota bacterium]